MTPALPKSLDVVGIGNAIVDVLVQADDSFLDDHGLTKGTMALIDEAQAERLYGAVGPGLETSGGSAANTLAGIAQLGGRAGFIGRVRDDQLGAIFSHDIRSVGARFDTPAATTGPSTARCLILVTPDAQRTMCTYLGASVKLDPEDLDLELVRQARVLYLEGYLWDSPEAQRAFVSAAEAARESGGEVALSLSDAFCVDRHRDSFRELVDGHVDILFANEMEITSLYKADSFEQAAAEVRGRCRIAALTRSE
jgi:sugar/nucleoside kinase (ribokinase family)